MINSSSSYCIPSPHRVLPRSSSAFFSTITETIMCLLSVLSCLMMLLKCAILRLLLLDDDVWSTFHLPAPPESLLFIILVLFLLILSFLLVFLLQLQLPSSVSPLTRLGWSVLNHAAPRLTVALPSILLSLLFGLVIALALRDHCLGDGKEGSLFVSRWMHRSSHQCVSLPSFPPFGHAGWTAVLARQYCHILSWLIDCTYFVDWFSFVLPGYLAFSLSRPRFHFVHDSLSLYLDMKFFIC